MRTKLVSLLLSGGLLGAFAVISVSLVAITHDSVEARIADNQYLAMKRKLDTILPTEQVNNDPLQDRLQVSARQLLGADFTQVYRARHDGSPVAVVLEPVVPDGYAGPIKLLVSVLRDGTLGGVRVVSHHETPGLGDKIEESKSDWVLGFTGKSLTNPPLEKWAVRRDGGEFDQFTGATITPRSVVKAVRDTLLYVQQQGEALYAPREDQAGGPTSGGQG
ncbi:electron transport complex subunit RsxG [Thermochromatium tepidum]|uniref:Ion-translocating oxidoreductase complex subunit G n=1 Tax=Thermochromatium tepidum ATCC 43061 TaxID=316276 RepID=A0A6I6DW79_THETI|nr:electron transport complex subunit RsxG [Thermochromatium tepidum]QGU31731.1 electron transport complex subunit RsxG [Thermochromatium tepidum ATCC 43061]